MNVYEIKNNFSTKTFVPAFLFVNNFRTFTVSELHKELSPNHALQSFRTLVSRLANEKSIVEGEKRFCAETGRMSKTFTVITPTPALAMLFEAKGLKK